MYNRQTTRIRFLILESYVKRNLVWSVYVERIAGISLYLRNVLVDLFKKFYNTKFLFYRNAKIL